MECSIILPAHNEVYFLERCVKSIERHMGKTWRSCEVIITEDGSIDGTDRIARRLTEKYRNVKHLHSTVRLGKGKALMNAMNIAQGEIIAFADVDMPIPSSFLPKMIEMAKKTDCIIIGSRLIKGSKVSRPVKRILFSILYNILVRILFQDGIHDHQCGMKAIPRHILFDVLPNIQAEGYFWDTAFLVKTKSKKYKVFEVPVEYRDRAIVYSSMKSVYITSFIMMRELFKLWWRIKPFNFEKYAK